MKLLSLLIVGLFLSTSLQAQEKGKASFYADKFEGKKTASGEVYHHHLKTAAHKTLAFGTKIKVTNTKNGKSVIVVVNDRGPFVEGRILDLSKSAAKEIGELREGVFNIIMEIEKK